MSHDWPILNPTRPRFEEAPRGRVVAWMLR